MAQDATRTGRHENEGSALWGRTKNRPVTRVADAMTDILDVAKL
jgi:hypothetical protein